MRVAFDLSSTRSNHRFRGIGSYSQSLYSALVKLTSTSNSIEIIPYSQGRNKTIQADLYHFPAFSPFFFSFPLRLISQSVVTIHDLIPVQYPSHFPAGIKGKLTWHLQKLLLPFSRHIITDSDSSKTEIVNRLSISREKVASIYLAADHIFTEKQENHSQIAKKYSLPNKFILYVGDLNWNKNVVSLAQACIELDYPFVVVGRQAAMTNFDKLHPWNQDWAKFQTIASKNPKAIIRLGYVPSKDLVQIYHLATCLVQPSFAEGFGLTVLEAMQSGCPVITSNTSSLKEITGNAALLINPHSRKALKTALGKVWNDSSSRVKLSTLGLKHSKLFSWDKTAKQVLAVYKKSVLY